ncbi:MAG: hsp70 nucleotide exchange factor fes1 [Alyxoria varia]|nr:MAG: hsp70 nucleotide exchange factor fes1 [Alyxoria varia]
MNDPNLNQLLKWSVRNSDVSREDATSASDPKAARYPDRGLNPEALSTLLGGPSDADRMKQSMSAILHPDLDLDNKLVAFDNFEQLIENIDNANNMENLGLWTPLTRQLESNEPELRRMAAWCISTAVQNNPKGQERAFVIGAIPTLVKLIIEDQNADVRKHAISAVSSEIRNNQPSLDEAMKHIPEDVSGGVKVDSGDMESVDGIIAKLRERNASS